VAAGVVPSIDVVARDRARMLPAGPVPRATGLIAPGGAVMVSDSDWVTIGGNPNQDSLVGPAVIQRTVNGGRSFVTMFSRRDAALWWLGRDGSSVVAAGDSYRHDRTGDQVDQRPLLLRSDDGGRAWTIVRPRVPASAWVAAEQLAFSGHGAAVAAASANQSSSFFSQSFPDGVLRSGDDGRSWRLVRLPPDGVAYGGVSWLAGGRTVFVTGVSRQNRGSRCEDAVWRSDDAGVSWRRIRGSCNRGASGIAFADARHGMIAGGGDPKYSAGQFVRSTSDGGAHWRTSWSTDAQYGESGIVSLAVPGGGVAWAVPGGITTGASVSYEGDALVRLRGSPVWHDTGQPATGISALRDGHALAYLDGKESSELALTTDAGRSWTVLGGLRDLYSYDLIGADGWVVDETDAGSFLSTDGGGVWRPFAPRMFDVHSELVAAQPGVVAALDTSGERCRLRISDDGGSRWRAVTVPGAPRGRQSPPVDGGGIVNCGEPSIAFAGAQRGVDDANDALCGAPGEHDPPSVALSTADGGRSWQPHRLADLADASDSAAAASPTVAAIIAADQMPSCAQIAMSHDGGRRWTIRSVPGQGAECSDVSVWRRQVWVTCDNGGGGIPRRSISTILTSTDAGRTWRATTTPFDAEQIIALGPGRAIAADGSGGASLLRTDDGGRSWQRYWPALPIGPDHPPVSQSS
jgi:photosystem II stability/assembly factor-like uncharacterized protein